MGGTSNAKLCILENPHGVKLPVSAGRCEHTISPVSASDQGEWKAYYGLADMEKLIEQKIKVQTYGNWQSTSAIIY